MFALDGFLSDAGCGEILALAQPARLAGAGIAFKHDDTGLSCELPVELAEAISQVGDRIESILGIENALRATLRFRRYLPGESHPPHVDNFRVGALDLVATALVCLTDVEHGGATRFPRAHPPVAVRPRRGRLIVWLNNLSDGGQDPAAYHEGEAVLSGEKSTLTDFIYADPLACRLLREGPPGVSR